MTLMLISAALLSLVITGLVRRYARRLRLIDIPNERSSHVSPTPRGGGLGIVVTFSLGVVVLWFQGQLESLLAVALLGSSLAVAAIGFADDRSAVAARWRFGVHLLAIATFLAACWPVSLGIAVLDAFAVVAIVLTILGMAWLLNLFNFMDGIDGIASVEALCVLAGFCLVSADAGMAGDFALLAALLAASCAGFLCWNWPPARIFLGDVGSGFIGFVLGAISVLALKSQAMTIWIPMILLAAFVTDATLTLLRRLLRGEKWYVAHRSHAYQWLSRRWGGHRSVVMVVLGVNLLWLLPLALVAHRVGPQAGWIALLAYLPLVAFCWFSGSGRSEAMEGRRSTVPR